MGEQCWDIEKVVLTPTELRRIAAKMCWGKIGYSKKCYAKERAKRLLGAGFPPSLVYECPFCGRWHLTSHRDPKERIYNEALRARVQEALAASNWKKGMVDTDGNECE